MKTLTIVLPDVIYQHLVAEARRRNVDAASLCLGVVADFLEQGRTAPVVSSAEQRASTTAPSNVFDVSKNFPGFPRRSVELAQRFVDEALKLPLTRAFKSFSGRGVGIAPNFAFVEYLLKRRPGGIGVSFYGSPDSLKYGGLRLGRNPNYSRAIAHTHEELKPLVELIRRSYDLKL